MKRLAALLPLALFLVSWSCSSRSVQIPKALDDLSTALNSTDQEAFKKLIWTSAEDYSAISSGTIKVSNLVWAGSYRYKYYFSNASFPSSGNSPITVNAECTVQTYLGDTLVSTVVYQPSSSTGSSAKFELANASTWFFMEDWKFSKLYLPGYANPLVKIPRFVVFTKP